MIGLSMNDLLGLLAKIMDAFKQLMGWFEILVLPTEDEKKNYPSQSSSEPTSEETPAEP